MKKTTKLKVYAFLVAMALGVLSPTTMNAQNDNFLRANDDFNGNRFASDWAIMNLGIGQEETAPLSGGLLVLGIAGAGYAVARRRRSLKKGAAMLAALAMMLGFTQCRKNLETIATAPASGVYITLDVDGGLRVVVDPNGAATYATVKFEAGDIIYVGNNGKYCGCLTRNGDKFTGNIQTPESKEDYLHFYFMGNKGGKSEPTSMSIADQKEKYPVISYGRSKYFYNSEHEDYKATLHNYCSIMKFPIAGDGTDKHVTLKGMNNKVTVDFSKNNAANNGAVSANPYTYSKDGFGEIILHAENGSKTEKWAIVLPQDGVESRLYVEGCKTVTVKVPEIEVNKYYNDDDVIAPITLESGTPSDLFTVGPGAKVRFSPGNLQYKNGEGWRFAENQWNIIEQDGEWNTSDWVSLFGWGTWSGTDSQWNPLNVAATDSDYSWNGKYFQGTLKNNTETNWYTLAWSEWNYMLLLRHNAKQLYGLATVAGQPGFVILPDAWTDAPEGCSFTAGMTRWDNNIYDEAQWAKMEADGAIFLPAAGFRYNMSHQRNAQSVYVEGVGNTARYWTSDVWYSGYAHYLGVWPRNYAAVISQKASVYFGHSVRLVH